MKVLKPLLLSLLLVSLLFVFSGCGETPAPTPTPDPTPGGDTNDVTESVGLEYVINPDETTCNIIGIGLCTDTVVRIPAEIDGYIVSTIASSAFKDCVFITEVVVPDTVTIIGSYAFQNCISLRKVVMPNSVICIKREAFDGCIKLEFNRHHNAYYLGNDSNPYHALIKACDTSVVTCKIHEQVKMIADNAFYWCRDLASILLPDGLINIGDEAFRYCGKLTSIEIPEGVTKIGDYTFSSCDDLVSVTIPESVTQIGLSAFSSCYNLTNINFNGSKARWYAIEKANSWDNSTSDYVIHCTNGDIPKKTN